jgi:anti-sigma28 factor (negative regulator of flagellin synthesis)
MREPLTAAESAEKYGTKQLMGLEDKYTLPKFESRKVANIKKEITDGI